MNTQAFQKSVESVQTWLDWCGENGEEPDAFSGAKTALDAYIAAVSGMAVAYRWREHYNAGKDDLWHLVATRPTFKDVEVQELYPVLLDSTVRKAAEPLIRRAEAWKRNSDNARVSVRLGDLRALAHALGLADRLDLVNALGTVT